ncbi:SMP-30/gluconolactonase/LRE family protein [Streptomyces nogalater]
MLTGVADGRILRVHHLGDPLTARTEVLARTGGPLGLELLPDGDLVVCDAERGLLRVGTDDGTVRVLADSVAGSGSASAATPSPSPTAPCTSPSPAAATLDRWIGDIVEHTGTGRLLRLAPEGGEPEVLLEGLRFANGLAVTADGSCLVLAETGACRLVRYRLTGPRAGHAEPFAELPGMPDNLWREGPGGPVWVALASPRVPRWKRCTAPRRPSAAAPPGPPSACRTARAGPPASSPWTTRTRRPPPHPPPVRFPHGHQRLRHRRPPGAGQPVGARGGGLRPARRPLTRRYAGFRP